MNTYNHLKFHVGEYTEYSNKNNIHQDDQYYSIYRKKSKTESYHILDIDRENRKLKFRKCVNGIFGKIKNVSLVIDGEREYAHKKDHIFASLLYPSNLSKNGFIEYNSYY